MWAMDSRQEKTNAALSPIQATLPELDTSPLPDAVHHYTDMSGVLGVVETGVLWATDYRYLNDSSEVRYTFDLASQVIRTHLPHKTLTSLSQAFLENISAGTSNYVATVYYLCCFSEADNSLSQWRAYGGRQGFSLMFPGDITHRPGAEEVAGRQGQTAGITLLKVNYDLKFQLAYVTRLLVALLDLCETDHMKSYPSTAEAISHITPFFWGQLERASYRFKHPDFADEREWRLVSWGSQAESFRPGATLTPYAKFRLFSTSHRPPTPTLLPLRAIRHGPTSLPNETHLALDRLLTAGGYPRTYCDRCGSDTPVRLQGG